MQKKYDALQLFSSGLDSLIAAKTLEAQGLTVLCLHFYSPFFGNAGKTRLWAERYGLDIEPVDISDSYVEMLLHGPAHGFGKHLNPCIDCKILMLSRARALMEQYGASFISTGEVLGQRPMSQRRDALNIISRDSATRDILLRPLCARNMPPTAMEEQGLVNRDALHSITGRGRRQQIELAAQFGIKEVPTPAGGCLLTEMESARRYWPVLKRGRRAVPADFHLANIGRQLWRDGRWLVIGRNQDDNERLSALRQEGDILFKLRDFPGPLGLARPDRASEWQATDLAGAAAATAWFSPRARRIEAGGVLVEVNDQAVCVELDRPPEECGWREPSWETARQELKRG